VGESAGKDHSIGTRQIGVTVPHELGFAPESTDRTCDVVLAVRAWKDDDRDRHGSTVIS
jgi:hypothetical protein